ncbi:MAG: fenitrothion hydrolase [Actinobacteria bacterium]|nr:fenitrothion hydrolase [Actinomycetota bacterium]
MHLGHGIGGVRDLPVPESLFFTTAAIVLVVSFVLLGALWRRPLLHRHAEGRRLPGALQAVLLSQGLRIVLGAVSVGLLVLTLATALLGKTLELLNFAPTFVYVIFWLGVPLLSVGLGDVWRVLSPWRAIADATVWAIERSRRAAVPVLDSPWHWGRYPAAVALFAFVALELAHPRPAYPRTLGVAVALYSYWALAGMAVFGRETWTKGGEGFAVAFSLLARIAPFAVRDGAIIVRWPFVGLAGAERVPGTLVFVAVLLGSTSFDGFSQTTTWQNLLGDVRTNVADQSQWVVDLATTFVSVVGLALFVGVVIFTYLVAVSSARLLVHAPRSLAPEFVLPLVPIVFAYLVAHYFSLFVIQGQFIFTLMSDPFGRGEDFLGTVDFAPNLAIVSPETVWYVQVAALVVGHVAGLAIAHDRAVALFESRRDALRSQYPMLGLMVLYTVGGLWLLSQG